MEQIKHKCNYKIPNALIRAKSETHVAKSVAEKVIRGLLMVIMLIIIASVALDCEAQVRRNRSDISRLKLPEGTHKVTYRRGDFVRYVEFDTTGNMCAYAEGAYTDGRLVSTYYTVGKDCVTDWYIAYGEDYNEIDKEAYVEYIYTYDDVRRFSWSLIELYEEANKYRNSSRIVNRPSYRIVTPNKKIIIEKVVGDPQPNTIKLESY